MDKWKIAYLCLSLAIVSKLINAETKVNIIGEELEGPNVCKRIIKHNVTVIVTESVPYKESKMEWCAQFPPRCRKEVIKLRQVNRTEVLEKAQAIRECCNGYKENEQQNGCIPHCQKSCGFGSCVAPNVCKCNAGYGGPSCDITCPPGLYGNKCKKKCDCANDAQCDPYSGECHCKKGYQGTKCENTCTPDRYGEGCEEICRCENGGKCNHISGECYCKKGFTGPLCEEKCKIGKNNDECRSICRCQNGGICNEDSQTCSCPPGWEGSVCANRCQPGFYGVNCTQVCECFNGASCDHIGGTCICEPGFMGDKCLDQCSFNKYGVNCTQDCVCYNGATCDKGSGKCFCFPGWVGDDCSERQCPDNKYGESCNETCECEKDNTISCHPHDGKCECKDGWTGNLCNRPCPFLKYGKSCAYQCDCKNNAQCSPSDGKCICPPGFTGEKCDSPCPEGSYGQDCSQRCDCKNGAKCSPETGECFCKPGWQGLNCERPCEINTFGQGCSMKCECLNGACNPITGECYCAVGWTGKFCENKCDPWTFGQNCTFECICEKQNSLACDHQTGHCLCRTEYRGSQTIKYTGVKCESTCPLGYYGSECHHQCNCKNNSSCDPNTGECFCDRGWIGKTCDTKCPNGYFGQNCKERCPDNIPSKTTCDHVTGEFKCRPGYIGLTCDHACKAGTYGEDCKHECKCEQGECHHVDGVCRCFPGWWGEFCEEPCPEDTWGTNCQHKCQCSNNAQCRKTDGLCICKAGFMGPKCEEVCPEGYFGNNCLEVCTCNRKPNFVCHPAHGCVCKAGWRGKNCDESIYAASTAQEEEYDITTEAFASTSYDDILTTPYQSSNQSSNDENYNMNNQNISFIENLTTIGPITTLSSIALPETTNFTFIPLETTTSVYMKNNHTLVATSGSYSNEKATTKFTFSPLDTTTASTLFTFAHIFNESTTKSIHSSSHENSNNIETTTLQDNYSISSTSEKSMTSLKSEIGLETTTNDYSIDSTTKASLENVLTTMFSGSFKNETNDTVTVSLNDYGSDNEQNREDKSINSNNNISWIENSGISNVSIVATTLVPSQNDDDAGLNNQNSESKSDKSGSSDESESKEHKSKPAKTDNSNRSGSHSRSKEKKRSRDKSRSDESNVSKENSEDDLVTLQRTTINPQFIPLTSFAMEYLNDRNKFDISTKETTTENNETNSESMKINGNESSSVNRSGMIWGIFCTFLFLGIIGAVLLYYRRRVANLKAEIGHVVRYMSDDPNRNFDNPVYSYQPSVNTDTSTLLHRHGMMNNLRQTRPSNMDRLNNFDHDSNSSGRAAQYSLQYDAELMNQKNHEADQTNPNFYSSIDDHLYDEIKLKCADLDMEYDHLDYSRPQQPIVPHYHRATSSTMSTISQRNRESDQSNNKFPLDNNTYDAPVPHPKKLNISVPLPPLPSKNINSNLTPSPSSSTASTVTQDDNIDAIISIEKPMNKDLNSKPDVINQQTDN